MNVFDPISNLSRKPAQQSRHINVPVLDLETTHLSQQSPLLRLLRLLRLLLRPADDFSGALSHDPICATSNPQPLMLIYCVRKGPCPSCAVCSHPPRPPLHMLDLLPGKKQVAVSISHRGRRLQQIVPSHASETPGSPQCHFCRQVHQPASLSTSASNPRPHVTIVGKGQTDQETVCLLRRGPCPVLLV